MSPTQCRQHLLGPCCFLSQLLKGVSSGKTAIGSTCVCLSTDLPPQGRLRNFSQALAVCFVLASGWRETNSYLCEGNVLFSKTALSCFSTTSKRIMCDPSQKWTHSACVCMCVCTCMCVCVWLRSCFHASQYWASVLTPGPANVINLGTVQKLVGVAEGVWMKQGEHCDINYIIRHQSKIRRERMTDLLIPYTLLLLLFTPQIFTVTSQL